VGTAWRWRVAATMRTLHGSLSSIPAAILAGRQIARVSMITRFASAAAFIAGVAYFFPRNPT